MRLQSGQALTVDQLNWPGADQLEGAQWERYEACAHLFVRELLRLKDRFGLDRPTVIT
jgi:hypothetical protein